MVPNRAIPSITCDNQQFLICLQRILLSLGLVSTNLKCVIDAFLKNEFTASIKKMEIRPRDTHYYIIDVTKAYENFFFTKKKKIQIRLEISRKLRTKRNKNQNTSNLTGLIGITKEI